MMRPIRRARRRLVALCFIAGLGGLLAPPAPAWAGGLGGALLRGATRGLTKDVRQATVRRTLRADLLRDSGTLAQPLARPRTVFRYTTTPQLQRELRGGIAPRSHMTSRTLPGRPLGADRAMRRYGLPARPAVRETVRIPKGHPVRLNRVLAGEPGRAEITSPRRLPPGSIRKVVRLRSRSQ